MSTAKSLKRSSQIQKHYIALAVPYKAESHKSITRWMMDTIDRFGVLNRALGENNEEPAYLGM